MSGEVGGGVVKLVVDGEELGCGVVDDVSFYWDCFKVFDFGFAFFLDLFSVYEDCSLLLGEIDFFLELYISFFVLAFLGGSDWNERG